MESLPNSHSSPMDIEDDEVVKEIDVFLANGLSDELTVLQFPLRPAWRELQTSSMDELRIKPKQHKLEMSFSVSVFVLVGESNACRPITIVKRSIPLIR